MIWIKLWRPDTDGFSYGLGVALGNGEYRIVRWFATATHRDAIFKTFTAA